jgi:hypothetical protein
LQKKDDEFVFEIEAIEEKHRFISSNLGLSVISSQVLFVFVFIPLW